MVSDQANRSNLTRAIVGTATTSALVILVLVLAASLGGHAEAVELPALAERMQVFNDPPLADTNLPSVVQQAQANLSKGSPGMVIPEQARRLAEGLGNNNVGLYALPTTAGNVCVVASEASYAATCVDAFDRSSGDVQWMIYSGETAPQTIVGLAADEAKAVRVVVGGVPQDATMGHNAFFWQAGAEVRREEITGLLVRQTDGSVVAVSLVR